MKDKILSKVRNFIDSEDGPTTVEYALMVGLIVVVSISAILSSGEVQEALWFNTANRMGIINN